MPNITNTGKRPRGLPNGHVLAVGASAFVQASILENETVKDWIERGILTTDAPKAETAEESEVVEEGDEKDTLIAALAEYGITKDRRSSVESLQKALADAQAADEETK